jgi:hypothetical protein
MIADRLARRREPLAASAEQRVHTRLQSGGQGFTIVT